MEPLQAKLSDGEKIESLKKMTTLYKEELEKTETDLEELLLSTQEADFLTGYIGEQKEVTDLRSDPEQVDTLEKRRQHLSALLDRLQKVTPEQKKVEVASPSKLTRY